MGVKVTRTGAPPPSLNWTAQHMGLLASGIHAQVTSRTFDRGVGTDGRPFARYSTKRVKIYYRSSTAIRLKPKGGNVFPWVRGPRRRGGGYDATKIGQPGGVAYDGGYAEFKAASRKGLTSSTGQTGAAVDLVLSGQLARSFRVIRTSRYAATIGITGTAREYGVHVDARRPFVGMSPQDVLEAERIFADAVAQAMGGTRGPAAR